MNIKTIVITGGPCGGKSTAMAHIKEHFTAQGYTVLVIPESATELIGGGIAPWTCATPYDYQVLQFRLQLEKEAIFHEAAQQMQAPKLLILCDRGIPDGKAYMTDAQYDHMAADAGFTPQQLFARYDAVFHLVTAADGALPFYTLENNSTRTETPEQAIALDRRTQAVWQGHPQHCIIGNEQDFKGKLAQLLHAMQHFLGEETADTPNISAAY